jgi:hypothetical protein
MFDSIYLLIGPLLVLFLLLIYHSLKTEGKRTTLLFFGLGIIFGLVRELFIGLICPLYSGRFKIGPISPAIVFGWVFAFYLAHYFATRITANTRLQGNFLMKVLLGTGVVLGISLIMETTAPNPQLQWWTWNIDVSNWPTLFNAPVFVFIGWGFTGMIFLTTFYLVQEYGFSPKGLIAIFSLFAIGIGDFVAGNLFILPPTFVPGLFISMLIFSSLYLLIITLYIKKRHPKSIPENILLNIFYSVLAGFIIVTLVVILQNLSPASLQILLLTLTLIFLGFFSILIVKQGYYIKSIVNENLKSKKDS